MANPQKSGSFLSRRRNSVALRQSGEAPASKGLSHDSAWTMLLCTKGPLNLSKALLFGSTLAGGAPLPHFPLWNGGRRFVPIHPSSERPKGPHVGVLTCALGFAARSSLARASLFRSCGSMLSLFPSKCAKYSHSGYLGERLQTILRRLSCFRSAKAQVAHCKRRMNVSR